jgi:hypothetical protein
MFLRAFVFVSRKFLLFEQRFHLLDTKAFHRNQTARFCFRAAEAGAIVKRFRAVSLGKNQTMALAVPLALAAAREGDFGCGWRFHCGAA